MENREDRSRGLHIVASFAKHQVEVTGSVSALLEFAETLVGPEASTVRTLTVPSDKTASPYDCFLREMRVEKNGDKVVINREKDALKISGSAESLRYLAENIRWFADSEHLNSPGDHLHIEYHPDHFYLAPGSDALIVSKEI